MKLLLILTVTLAFSLADEVDIDQPLDDLQAAAASIDLLKSQQWTQPNGYIPTLPWNAQSSDKPSIPSIPSNPIPNPPSIPSIPPVQNNYFPIQSDTSQNSYYPPQNNYNNPPSDTYGYENSWSNQNTAQNTWNNPQNSQNQETSWNKPQNTGTQNTWNKPQNTGTWNNWNQVPSSTSSTTTPIPVIKNEQSMGENGSYKYEYEIADGTHVAEEGYFKNPNTEHESIVKKGFYSFTASDGKVYTVTYWADETGFHATGDHLPKPPPIPPAIQASIEQNAKEEAAKAEAEKNKQQQQHIHYPVGQEPPKPIYQPQQPAPQQPTQYPQQTYYPGQQQTFYPPSNYYPVPSSPPQSGYGRRR